MFFKMTLVIGTSEDNGRLAGAMLGRSTNIRTIFHRTLGGLQNLMPVGVQIGVQALAMSGVTL